MNNVITRKNCNHNRSGERDWTRYCFNISEQGVSLGLIARTEADLQAVAEEVSAHGVRVEIATADITDNAQVEQAIDQLYKALGKFDILINNAGIAKFGGFLDLTIEEWERIIRVNLFGMYYVTRAVLPKLIEQKSGDIINISSTAGEKGGAAMSAYSASKFGVMGLTESLAMEARKHDIRVTALTPSTVVTDLAINEGLVKGDEENMLQPEDVADLVLASLQLNRRVFMKSAGVWTTNP